MIDIIIFLFFFADEIQNSFFEEIAPLTSTGLKHTNRKPAPIMNPR